MVVFKDRVESNICELPHLARSLRNLTTSQAWVTYENKNSVGVPSMHCIYMLSWHDNSYMGGRDINKLAKLQEIWSQ